jgi:hypothetical protein
MWIVPGLLNSEDTTLRNAKISQKKGYINALFSGHIVLRNI